MPSACLHSPRDCPRRPGLAFRRGAQGGGARGQAGRVRQALKDVLFETGYGPSGLPHIGTFGEVARTTWVRHAFELMSEVPTPADRLLRRHGRPQQSARQRPQPGDAGPAHLGKPLTACPIPSAPMRATARTTMARLKAFLDRFGFEYEFLSSTDCYKRGRFDEALLPCSGTTKRCATSCCRRWARSGGRPIRPSCRFARRRAGCCRCRCWNGTPSAAPSSIEEDGAKTEVPVTGGHCKLQWKADWAMRWLALGVDYEMAGKDLISSVELSSKIVRALGGAPPEGFNYELFLDEQGQRISKSKGNGLVGRRMADLRPRGKHRAVHVSEAARGQEALFRRHPQGGGRLYRPARSVSCARGRGGAAGKPGLAYPWRQAAGGALSGQLRAAAQSGQRLQRA